MGWFSRLIKALAKAKPKTPTQTITPVETPRTSIVVVGVYHGPRANDNKLPGAIVTTITDANPGGVTGTTDGAGNVNLVMSNPGDYDFTATLAGYVGPSVHLTLAEGQAVAMVSLEMSPAVAPWQPKVLSGFIRIERRAYADSYGIRPMIGASAFAAPWLCRHDRGRLEANYEFLARHHVDFVRILCEVGGPTWSDRIIDPTWPDYVDVLADTATLAWQYGLRTQYCLFGGGQALTEQAQWDAFQRMYAALVRVPATIQLAEIQNESQGPLNALARRMAETLRTNLGCPVALTGSPEPSLKAIYAGSAANVGLLHTDRSLGDHGHRSVRQIWGIHELDLPQTFQNNEPVGFKSSVRSEMDYRKHAAEALTTWISGGAAYVWHNGSGVYFRDYDHPIGHRYANLSDEPNAGASLDLINAVRNALPVDVMNWTRANNHWQSPNPVPPFRFSQDHLGDDRTSTYGLVRAYSAIESVGGRFCTVAIGCKGKLTTTPVWAVKHATIRSLSDFDTVREWDGTVNGDEETFLIMGE